MKQQDRDFLNSEAKLIHESDRTEAQILSGLEIAFIKGQAEGIAEAIRKIAASR